MKILFECASCKHPLYKDKKDIYGEYHFICSHCGESNTETYPSSSLLAIKCVISFDVYGLGKREKGSKMGLMIEDSFSLGDTGYSCRIEEITEDKVLIQIPRFKRGLFTQGGFYNDEGFLLFELFLNKSKRLSQSVKPGISIDITLEEIYEDVKRSYM